MAAVMQPECHGGLAAMDSEALSLSCSGIKTASTLPTDWWLENARHLRCLPKGSAAALHAAVACCMLGPEKTEQRKEKSDEKSREGQGNEALPDLSPRHVTFDLGSTTVHKITPYSEVYGLHPRDFNFDKRRLPPAWCFVSPCAANAVSKYDVDADLCYSSDEDSEEAEAVKPFVLPFAPPPRLALMAPRAIPPPPPLYTPPRPVFSAEGSGCQFFRRCPNRLDTVDAGEDSEGRARVVFRRVGTMKRLGVVADKDSDQDDDQATEPPDSLESSPAGSDYSSSSPDYSGSDEEEESTPDSAILLHALVLD